MISNTIQIWSVYSGLLLFHNKLFFLILNAKPVTRCNAYFLYLSQNDYKKRF